MIVWHNTQIKKALFFLALTIGTIFSSLSCSDLTSSKSDNYRYRIPWSDRNGNVSIQDVTIDDLQNPFVMQGGSAKIIATGDYSLTRGPVGEAAEPNFLKSGQILIPTDTLSVSAVTAYAHMNRIKKIDKKLGIANLLKWPRVVGVNTVYHQLPGYYGVNNAFYSTSNDTINILPYTHSGLPMSLNGNTIAHEHFHSIFHSQIDWTRLHFESSMKEINSGSIKICEDLEFYQEIVNGLYNKGSGRENSSDTKTPDKTNPNVGRLVHQANYIIARGWDEGSADLYSYFYNKNEKFLEDSFPDSNIYYRNLAGHYQVALRRKIEVVFQLKIMNDLRCRAGKTKKLDIKNASSTPLRFENETSYYYQMGSDFAKFFKRLSDSTTMHNKYGEESLKKIVLAMIQSLPKLDEYLKTNYHKSIMSPLQLIKFILESLDVVNDPEVCTLIHEFYGLDYCGLPEESKESA